MANNSAKKNEQQIRTISIVLMWTVYGLIGWVMIFNSFSLMSESISIFHWILCLLISGINYFCYKQVMKCWELQLPSGAADYYYDILAMNSIVQLFDPFTHLVWHIYWSILLFALWHGGKWLWDYITPKYVEADEDEEDNKKKDKKERKERIKYVKH